jgi:ABC-type nitrate/sulfonate/bicarbonate transport system ATPase subunit
MNIVDIKNLGIAFDGKRILDNFSISIKTGETVALVGRSGAGKTTLLRTMAGLHPPSVGTVRILGKPPRDLFGHGEIQYLHQVPTPWRHLTVMGNMELAFGLLKKKPKKTQIKQLLDRVGLSGHEYNYPAQLSQGECARLTLARVFIGDPKVVFVDEPFASLDPIRREDLNESFRSLQKESDAAIVMVTHDVIEAIRFSHRIVVVSALADTPRCFEVQHLATDVDPNRLAPEHISLRDEIFDLMKKSVRAD